MSESVSDMPRRRRAVEDTPAPQPVRLVRPHGFIEEGTGRHRHWAPGDIIVDPAEIALLKARGAPIEPVG